MSDYPNGRPPGQNNLDAGSPQYVAPENDPSAGAQKPDEVRPKEDGVEVREEPDPAVQQELNEASRNVVEPSTAEPPPKQEQPAQRTRSKE